MENETPKERKQCGYKNVTVHFRQAVLGRNRGIFHDDKEPIQSENIATLFLSLNYRKQKPIELK